MAQPPAGGPRERPVSGAGCLMLVQVLAVVAGPALLGTTLMVALVVGAHVAGGVLAMRCWRSPTEPAGAAT